jgi:hypothetical protein
MRLQLSIMGDKIVNSQDRISALIKEKIHLRRILATGRIDEPFPVQNSDTKEWYYAASNRSITNPERTKFSTRIEEIEDEIKLLEVESTAQEYERPKDTPNLPSRQLKVLEKVKQECLDRNLKKERTVPRQVKYEIAQKIGVKVPALSDFRAGDKAYQRISKYLSELGYSQKTAIRYSNR